MDEQITKDLNRLRALVTQANLPSDLTAKAEEMLARLQRQAEHGFYAAEYEQVQHYIDWICHLPWDVTTPDNLDLTHVRKVLDSHHFGLDELKVRFLEYLSVLALNQTQANADYHAPILLLVGLVGTGKTTIAKSIADAMGRKFVRIPFGGMGSSFDLRGRTRSIPDSEPGQIIKGLRRAGCRNPVILLDEIDRVSDAARGEIMGVLVELLDPEQNMAFTDHYIDFAFDLSHVLFIATANNTTHISTAVMDRLEPILMPSYTDEEKIAIARDYVLPAEIKKAGIPPGAFEIGAELWPKIVRPLGFDGGIRTLERTIQGIVRKVARRLVEGQAEKFVITEANLREFLPLN